MGRTFDHHVYDLIEVGIEDFKSMKSFSYDKKLAPRSGSKPLFAFVGELFETVEELKHLKEVLLDLFRGEVIENLNLAGVDRAFVCTAMSPKAVNLMHCGIRLKKSGTFVPKIELVEVGPSMKLVVRRHRLPNEDLRKEAMKTASDKAKKKQKNVSGDIIQGRIGKIYVPHQKVGTLAPSHKIKGLKRERRQENDGTAERAKKPKPTTVDS